MHLSAEFLAIRETTITRSWLARAGVVLMAIVLLRLGFELWWVDRIHEHLWTQIGVSLFYLAGVTFLFLGAANVRHQRLDMAGFLVMSMALGFYTLSQISVFAVHYTSDALLFVHEAAFLTLNGLNPYQHSLVGGYEAFSVPYYVQTPTTSGGLITNLNYPALAFLAYTPFVALGLDDLRIVSAAILMATVGLVYVAMPRHLRLLLIGLLFLSSFFISFSVSGFDILYIFLLMVTVVLWRRHPAAAMIAFGLSAAVKQPVWFIAPFLLVRLWKDASDHDAGDRRLFFMLKHASFSIAAFLVPNAWFIVWDPLTWLSAVLTPVGGSPDVLVPLSQGLTIVFYTGFFYIPGFLLTALAGSVLFFLVALYWLYYQRFREALWVAPALILTVNERALQNYYEMFYPIVMALLMATLPSSWGNVEDEEPDAVAIAQVPGQKAAVTQA